MKSLYKYSRIKLIVSIVMVALAMLLLFPSMLKSLQSVTKTGITPDRSFGYTVGDLEEMREIYGEEGAKRYFLTRVTYDLIWPFIYLFFIINMVAFLLDGLEGKGVKMMKVLPFIAVAFDLFENMFCSIYFFHGNVVIGIVAAVSSRIKWYMLCLIVILFFVLGIKKYITSKNRDRA